MAHDKTPPQSAALIMGSIIGVGILSLPAAGGPYADARSAFGNGRVFSNAWSSWITARSPSSTTLGTPATPGMSYGGRS